MIAMQKLQPELKKLQQKYKVRKTPAPQRRDDEALQGRGRQSAWWMPADAAANPVLIMLYGVIKGLANKVLVHGKLVSLPRYIPTGSKMYHDLVRSGGQIKSFGMDLNLKLFSVHSSFLAQIPFILFVLAAVGLQYFQMAQLNTEIVRPDRRCRLNNS